MRINHQGFYYRRVYGCDHGRKECKDICNGYWQGVSIMCFIVAGIIALPPLWFVCKVLQIYTPHAPHAFAIDFSSLQVCAVLPWRVPSRTQPSGRDATGSGCVVHCVVQPRCMLCAVQWCIFRSWSCE
jgi:hypothetical protein